MIIKVKGYLDLDFVTDEGNRIEGTNVYGTFPATNRNVIGEMCRKFFFTRAKLAKGIISVGDELNVTFDYNGKVDTVSVVDSDVEVG